MALTNSGTAVYLASYNLPAGYTLPTVTKFTDHEYKYENAVMTVEKAGVDEATALATFAALVTAISSAVSAMVTADYDTTGNTVTVYANLKSVTTNFDLTGVLYTTGAVNYLCTVDVFVKTVAL